jgi:hypothetical protein
MNSTVTLGILGSAVVIISLFELLRRQRLREKYAVLWFLVAVGVLATAIFPGLLTGLANLVGVEVPVNLLFFLASLVLLVLTLQHSYELGRLEEKTRVLAEEIGLLRLELDRREARPDRVETNADPNS